MQISPHPHPLPEGEGIFALVGATRLAAHQAKQRCVPTHSPGTHTSAGILLPAKVGAPSRNAHFSGHLLGTHSLRGHFLCRLRSALPHSRCQHRCQCAIGGAGMGLNDALRRVVLSRLDLRSMPWMILPAPTARSGTVTPRSVPDGSRREYR